jgi:hypothetical protein
MRKDTQPSRVEFQQGWVEHSPFDKLGAGIQRCSYKLIPNLALAAEA